VFRTDQDDRIRRVKCDEQKPECARCTKFGIKCDGYPTLEKRTSVIRATPLKIRPWLGPKSQVLAPSSRVLLYHLPPARVARNDMEDRYFEAFRKEIIPEISGIWNNSFWDSIVLTACDEPFIRDAVLAIAAINLSIKEDRKKPRTGEARTGSSTSSAKHYQFALERFGRAVRTMRSTLTNEEHHLRKALIGCLLVFCFEGFQGYPKQALVHVISGYHLLQSWLLKKAHPLVLPNSTPPASSLIEKELMDAFNRLHTNAVTVMGDSCSEETYMLEYASGEQVVQDMPKEFADFGEAHRYFVHIMKRCAVFVQVRVLHEVLLTTWSIDMFALPTLFEVSLHIHTSQL
jgi:Fungal Zn(2)-Cys(6) binuclear cluster domain/Fungal specific transcription factor domain